MFPKKRSRKSKPIKSNGTTEKLFEFGRIFLNTSTIHGLVHIGHPQRHPLERLIWTSLVAAALYGVYLTSRTTLTRYTQNPTVISMERDRFSWNTSFPAATMCLEQKINEPLLNLYVEMSTEPNKTQLRSFLVSLANATYNNFEYVTDYDGITEDQYMSILLDLQFDFGPKVTNSGIDPHKYKLQRIISEMGICYSFNSNLAIYNSPEYWEEDQWGLMEPTDTFYVSPLDGEVFANIVNISSGFEIYIHGPYEVADIASKKITSADDHFLQLYLSALSLFSSDNIRSLTVKQRNCRFYHESNLRRSPVYSFVLCRMECRASLAKQLCGCVPHFHRKLDGERTCNVAGLHCLSKYKDRLILLKGECSCMANCDEVNYVLEDMDTREWFLGANLQWGLKDYPKMRLRRDILFGFSDLLVYIGGMAGLFLGCSVLSFIEIVYFFTLRLHWFMREHKQKRTQGNLGDQPHSTTTKSGVVAI